MFALGLIDFVFFKEEGYYYVIIGKQNLSQFFELVMQK